MAYEKQGFVDGMILKAENLVKIEEGIIEAEESVESSVQDALEEAKESGEFDGKSAYQYAQEGGFTGTEATFAERLARGNIHIGTDAPADGSEVWIDTDEEPTSDGSIDVTAEVGQTIIVKEVDENGKPTKWESADYQPKTHGIEIAELLPITAAIFDEEGSVFAVPNVDFQFEVGRQYTISWNGTPYTCIALDMGDSVVAVGNAALILETGDTGEPFFAATEGGILLAMPLDGSTEVNIGVSGEIVKKIDKSYLPKDTLYGEPIYAKPVLLLEDWYYAQTDHSDLLTSTGGTEIWVNTKLTKKHWEKLVEIFETHLLLKVDYTIEVAKAYNASEYYELEWYSFKFYASALQGIHTILRLRWSDTDNCVQRACFVDTVG